MMVAKMRTPLCRQEDWWLSKQKETFADANGDLDNSMRVLFLMSCQTKRKRRRCFLKTNGLIGS